MNAPLPAELRGLVDRTLSAARLRARERERVRQELECHFADGLDAGMPAATLAASFGDPEIAGTMIRRARRPAYRRARTVMRTSFALAAAGYIAAVISVQSAGDSPLGSVLAHEAEQVSFAVASAEPGFADAQRIVESYHIAASLRRRRDYWSETSSLVLLDRVAQAADTLLDERGREWLRDSLRALEASEGLAPRRDLVDATVPVLVASLYGRDGRIGPRGRRLIVHTKSGRTLSPHALLLEPFYFALPVSRQRLQAFVSDITAAQLARADVAARRLTVRVGPVRASQSMVNGAERERDEELSPTLSATMTESR